MLELLTDRNKVSMKAVVLLLSALNINLPTCPMMILYR